MSEIRPDYRAAPDRPLHAAWPRLASRLAHIPLAHLPTPLTTLEQSRGTLTLKHDERTSDIYGGNKVRKLEYLLGRALHRGCTQVATFGAAGSNHATATAVHAARLGLHCISFLSRQRPTPWISANLDRQVAAGARLVFLDGDRRQRQAAAHDVLRASARGTLLIPMGGSSIVGTLGYVNAGFELAAQVRAGELEAPDLLYLPFGTMGTAIGLLIGLQASGLPTRMEAVRVVHLSIGSATLAESLYRRTVAALRRLDPAFPPLRLADANWRIRHDQFGAGYADATPAARAAVATARDAWGLHLETTYSGKAAAALLADRDAGLHDGRRVLFWNTFSGTRPTPDAQPPPSLPGALAAYYRHAHD